MYLLDHGTPQELHGVPARPGELPAALMTNGSHGDGQPQKVAVEGVTSGSQTR
jgi:hypothetical protein